LNCSTAATGTLHPPPNRSTPSLSLQRKYRPHSQPSVSHTARITARTAVLRLCLLATLAVEDRKAARADVVQLALRIGALVDKVGERPPRFQDGLVLLPAAAVAYGDRVIVPARRTENPLRIDPGRLKVAARDHGEAVGLVLLPVPVGREPDEAFEALLGLAQGLAQVRRLLRIPPGFHGVSPRMVGRAQLAAGSSSHSRTAPVLKLQYARQPRRLARRPAAKRGYTPASGFCALALAENVRPARRARAQVLRRDARLGAELERRVPGPARIP